MSRLTILAGVGALLAQATIATAADMQRALPPPMMDYPPVTEWRSPAVLDLNYGWYLRGDFGGNLGLVRGAEVGPGALSASDNRLYNAYMGGIGAGIKTRWLRTDVTLDYHAPMAYRGSVFIPNDVSADVSAFSALFNGYLDLGTWYRMTPYIGAGAGAAYVRTSNYQTLVAPGMTGGSNSEWNVAWALMTGLGVGISPNLVMDAGYRYINFGDVVTATGTPAAATLKNIAAHEIRIGVRWSYDDLPVAR